MSNEQKPDITQSTGKPKKGNGYRQNGGNGKVHQVATKFEGSIPELKGYIYDCVQTRQADQYMKTTEYIANYFVNHQKNAGAF
jgi:hypothetical protein